MVSRRGFLKLIGVGAAALAVAPDAVAQTILHPPTAPLYIPAQNLDLGVPRRIVTATEMPSVIDIDRMTPKSPAAPRGDIPMLLINSEFSPPFWQQYGSPKVPAGTTLYVDGPTAQRWVDRGIAVPGPSAPIDMQRAYAVRRLKIQQDAGRRRFSDFTVPKGMI